MSSKKKTLSELKEEYANAEGYRERRAKLGEIGGRMSMDSYMTWMLKEARKSPLWGALTPLKLTGQDDERPREDEYEETSGK